MEMLTDRKEISRLVLEGAKKSNRVMCIDQGDALHQRTRRHLKPYSDGLGYVYVRTGKRGTTRRYIIGAKRVCDDLYIFTMGGVGS